MNSSAPTQGGGGPPAGVGGGEGGPPGGGPPGAGGGRPTLDQILFMALGSNAQKITSWSSVGASAVGLLTGFILMDTARYFDYFGSTDKRWVRIGVAAGTLGCFVHMIICCVQTWLLVDHAFTDFHSVNWIDSRLGMTSDLFGAWTNFAASSFYAWRAYKLSKGSKWISYVLAVLNSAAVVMGSTVAIKGMMAPRVTIETVSKLREFQSSLTPLRKAWGGLVMAADGAVCVVMMYYLFQSRSSVFHREKKIYHRVNALIVETMLPPVICVLLLDIHANTRAVAIGDWRRILRMILPPLYFVSLLHSLVSRATIRRMLEDNLASDGIQQLSGSQSKGAVFVAHYPGHSMEKDGSKNLEASTDHIVSVPLEKFQSRNRPASPSSDLSPEQFHNRPRQPI